MAEKFFYKAEGICAQGFDLYIEDNIIVDFVYHGQACDGNLKGICMLLKGMDVRDAAARLRGICCRRKTTSCPDQISKALEAILTEKEAVLNL